MNQISYNRNKNLADTTWKERKDKKGNKRYKKVKNGIFLQQPLTNILCISFFDIYKRRQKNLKKVTSLVLMSERDNFVLPSKKLKCDENMKFKYLLKPLQKLKKVNKNLKLNLKMRILFLTYCFINYL